MGNQDRPVTRISKYRYVCLDYKMYFVCYFGTLYEGQLAQYRAYVMEEKKADSYRQVLSFVQSVPKFDSS
jgi:hypothetical protein